ncbi:hypothetical protein GWI33_014013 [Rhynchophorus ferrugineus]|uniref:Sulfhydryl oxidase n=1 Tax=Rhynchophorus ferrugineus TaxID=354439 RepID=A0A834I881_RHYFE|nr:hypothetical protein GWI33_014013 [Rhynchophorus ferrugineus]
MKDIKFYINFAIFLLLVLINQCNNASIGKYERFTGDQGLYSSKDDVEILTIDNFKEAITNSGKAWIVEFYNSWCGFCQKFAPSWKKFATDVKDWRDVVIVAAIDCSDDRNNPICREYEIMGYPTLRYFGEDFHESEKNYGSPMEKGVSAEDHKHDLLKKMISEQIQGRGQQFPNLLPYTASDVDDIFIKAASDVTNSIVILQEPGSLLGPEITMDLHRSSNIVTHYAFSNNTNLVTKLDAAKFPSVYLVNREKQFEHLSLYNTDKTSIIEVIKESLKHRHIELVLNQTSQGSSNTFEKKKDVNALIEKVKTMGDVVFQMDLETTLRYSLKREVGSSKYISGEKLEALKKYLHILTRYFPFGRAGKAFLNDVNNYVNSNSEVSGSEIAQMVAQAEREEANVFSTPKKWLGCQGSSDQYRRYPCGLWTMFHYLTVNVADYEQGIGGNNPRLALEAMHGYIKHFFGCAGCSSHFQEMAKRRELDKVSSFPDSILWLWMAHNEVNNRLSGDLSEDPEYPKIQFPSPTNCPSCRNADDTWNNSEGPTPKLSMQVWKDPITRPRRGYRRKLYRYKNDLLGKV